MNLISEPLHQRICEMRDNAQNIFLKEVGHKVRSYRKAKNYTMESLAFDTDMEYRQIGRIERGEINTTLISMLRISTVLKVDFHLFFMF